MRRSFPGSARLPGITNVRASYYSLDGAPKALGPAAPPAAPRLPRPPGQRRALPGIVPVRGAPAALAVAHTGLAGAARETGSPGLLRQRRNTDPDLGALDELPR